MDFGEQLKTLTSPELIGPNDRFGFMRITMPVIYERRERSNDEEIHDLINLIKNIYNGNPPKYMIREGKSETDVKLVM